MKIAIEKLEDLTARAIRSYGYDEEETAAIKDVLLYAQLRGNNQGIVKLVGKGIPKNPDAGEIEIVKETAISVRINANKNHAMIVVNKAVDMVISKAKDNGFALAGVCGTCASSGAIGYYASRIAREEMIGFVYASSPERVAAHGSYEPVYGTNPVAVAVPGEADDIVLDMSTAAISFYGLVEANTAGRDIPGDVAYDSAGKPTTSAKEAIGGAIRSLDRSHKGSALGMMGEILAGPLVGAAFCGIGDSKGNWGHLIYAIDPGMLIDREEFAENVSKLVAKVKSTKKLEGVSDIYAPGERGRIVTKRNIDSGEIEVEDNLLQELRKVAERA